MQEHSGEQFTTVTFTRLTRHEAVVLTFLESLLTNQRTPEARDREFELLGEYTIQRLRQMLENLRTEDE